jgi:hypothetical protein
MASPSSEGQTILFLGANMSETFRGQAGDPGTGESTTTATASQVTYTPADAYVTGADLQAAMEQVGGYIGTNTTDIAANTADVATNTADVATNTADIATNTADIATNTANISTNTSNISTNSSAISTLQNITLTASTGLTGGGDLTANRSFAVDINSLTADATPDTTNDYVMTYDASAAGLKKVALTNLGAGGGSTSTGSWVDAGDFYLSPVASTDVFDLVGTVTENTWESVGPTGSGATNIFTGLDAIDSTADWVDLKIWGTAIETGVGANTWYYQQVQATGYPGGTTYSATMGGVNMIHSAGGMSNSSGDARFEFTSFPRVPLDGNGVFDIGWNCNLTGSQNIYVWVIGYGFNNP